jgi:hypothetical protein
MIKYDFAEKFSKNPALRYRSLSDDSGEEFREDILEKMFLEKKEVLINVEGIESALGASFLSESFGNMAVKYGKKELFKIFKFDISQPKGKVTNDEMIKRVDEALKKAGKL